MTRLLIAAALVALLAWLPGRSAEAASTPDITISVGDFWFCNSSYENGVCPTSIDVGDTIEWEFSAMAVNELHTVTDCGADCNNPTASPLFDSGTVGPGPGGPNDPYKFTFNTPGIYNYYCEVHPFSMQGEINVGGVGGVAEIDAVPLQFAMENGEQSNSLLPIEAAFIAGITLGVTALAGAGSFALRRLSR